MTCKVCGSKQHYCSSCDFDEYLYHDYCGKTCFEKSDEFISYTSKLKDFFNSLNEDQKKDLWFLWNNGIFNEGLYESYANDIIKA